MDIRNRVISEFMELVSIDSLSLHERAMADRLLEKLSGIGIDAFEDDAAAKINGNAGNVYGCLKGNPAMPGIILSAHMDTVSPGVGKRAVIEDEIIRPSGDTILGADDLSGVVAALETIRQLAEECDTGGRRGDVHVVFTVAEEIGLCGAYNFDYAGTGAKLAIVLDSTGSPGNIVVQAPSHKRLNVNIHGKAAHAGVEPEKGISAIQIAARAIDRMRLGRIDRETTANIGVIDGGKATNIICDNVDIKAECRSIDHEKLELQLAHMSACFDEAAEFYGGQAKTDIIREYSAFSVDRNSAAVKIALRALEENGIEPNLVVSGGGSDANVINALGITTVNMGSGMYDVHSVNEYLKIGDVLDTVKVLKSIIRSGGMLHD